MPHPMTGVLPPPPPQAVDPFTTYLVADIIRMFDIVASTLLALVILRLMWLRLTDPDHRIEDSVHPFLSLSFAGLLLLLGLRRFDNLGSPPDLYLVGSTIFVLFGIAGVRVRALHRPAMLRREDLYRRHPR